MNPLNSEKLNGYTAVISYEGQFLAAGTDGRIDRISLSGKVMKSEKFPGINFNCLLADNQAVIAAGGNGVVMLDSGNGFHKINSSTDEDINALALFDGVVIAGTDGGEIILGDSDGFSEVIQLDLKGNIVSLSSGKKDCYGVTDEGEIIHSADGVNWDVFNFNKAYAGFYKPCSFTRVLVTKKRIAVTGINDDGSPAVLFSNHGKVWTERDLNYTDGQGLEGYLVDNPNDIIYDDQGSQFFVACSKGKLMALPSCTHCNTISALTENDLKGISGINNTLIVVGENFFIKCIRIR